MERYSSPEANSRDLKGKHCEERSKSGKIENEEVIEEATCEPAKRAIKELEKN